MKHETVKKINFINFFLRWKFPSALNLIIIPVYNFIVFYVLITNIKQLIKYHLFFRSYIEYLYL